MTAVWIGIAGFVLLLAIGLRAVWRRGRKRDALVYAALVVWCAFIAVPGFAGTKPLLSPVAMTRAIFSPLGKILLGMFGIRQG